MKEWEGLKLGGGGKWQYQWASVGHGVDIFIIMRIQKKKTTNKIQENKYEQPSNKISQYKVSCFIVLIVLKAN